MDKLLLKKQLKEKIIEYLNLLEMDTEDIKDDMPLFGEGLGLDSIDSIELLVMLEREFSVKLENPTLARKVLSNVNEMANYIIEHSTNTTGE